MIKSFEQFISEGHISSDSRLNWEPIDRVAFKPYSEYVIKKRNKVVEGKYLYKVEKIPYGGLDEPMSEKHDDIVSAININDIQEWHSNNEAKGALKFGDKCLIRYPRFALEKRLDPQRAKEKPYHYEVQMYLGGKFDTVDHDLSSTLDVDTVEWCKLD